MGDVLRFHHEPKATTEEYFGGCPECGKTDGHLNVGGNHWAVCQAHNTTWPIGYNLFSSWRDEPQELHEANERKLRAMRVVDPIYPGSGPEAA